jgi:hypothetical protein
VHAVNIDFAKGEPVRGGVRGTMVELRVRRIDEVTRGITARDEYEKRSRERAQVWWNA